MNVMQCKVDMMQDELSHRRKEGMALAARNATSPEPIRE